MQKLSLVLAVTISCSVAGIGDALAEEHFKEPNRLDIDCGLGHTAVKAEPVLKLGMFIKPEKENPEKPVFKTGDWAKFNPATGAIQPLNSASPKSPNENPLFIGDFNGGWY